MAKERQALPSRVATERRAERCHCWTRKGVERQALPWLVGAERPGRRAQRTNLQGASALTPLALRVSVLAGFRNQGFQKRICLNSLGGAVSATSECMTPDRYCCMSPTLQPTRNWHTVRNGTCEWANGAGTIMRRCSELRGSAVQVCGDTCRLGMKKNPGHAWARLVSNSLRCRCEVQGKPKRVCKAKAEQFRAWLLRPPHGGERDRGGPSSAARGSV